jgi:hypothetical protein
MGVTLSAIRYNILVTNPKIETKGRSETLQSYLVLLSVGIQLEPDSSLHILIRLISKSTQIFYYLGRVFASRKAELAR